MIVKDDWTDLISTHAQLESNPESTAQIARNARKTMEYLDPYGVSCYIRELIRRYADVCQWIVQKPDIDERVRVETVGTGWLAIEDFLLKV